MINISRDLLLKETAYALVFLNPSPVLPGHSLVFPKRQVSQLFDLTPEESLDI